MNVAFFDFGEKTQIINYLNDKYNWNPTICCDNSRGSDINTNYKETLNIDTMKVRQGQFDYSEVEKITNVDKSVLDKLSPYALDYLNVLEDTNGHNFSFSQRKFFYYRIIKYWLSVMNSKNIELVVFYTLPHTAASLSLYLVCKYILSINIIYIDIYPLLDRNLYLISDDIDNFTKQVESLYLSNNEINTSDKIIHYINNIKLNLEPSHMKNIKKNFGFKSSYFDFKGFIYLIVSTLLKGTGFKKSQLAWKKNYHLIESKKSLLNNFEYFFFIELVRNKNKFLRNKYRKYCKKPDFSKKFIYFASSYQPESRSNSMSGIFQDQILALSMLNENIPDDWIILFKEHPSIFSNSPFFRGSLYRDDNYYEKITELDKVTLISEKTDNFQLIEKSQAVSTIGGTTGWEAVVKGKPVINFGNCWYKPCKSIFNIESELDLKIAIDKIIIGYKIDDKDIVRYLSAIEKCAYEIIARPEINKDENIKIDYEKIGEALYSSYAFLNGKN